MIYFGLLTTDFNEDLNNNKIKKQIVYKLKTEADYLQSKMLKYKLNMEKLGNNEISFYYLLIGNYVNIMNVFLSNDYFFKSNFLNVSTLEFPLSKFYFMLKSCLANVNILTIYFSFFVLHKHYNLNNVTENQMKKNLTQILIILIL